MNILSKIANKLSLILNSHYKIANAISFVRYSQMSEAINYIQLLNNRNTTVYPVSFFNEPLINPIQLPLEDTYYSVVENCNIIGQSNVVLKKNYLLYDLLADKSNPNINVTDKGLLLLFNRVVHLGKYHILNYSKASTNSIAEGIMLSGNFTNNYYHFVLEYITKFELIFRAAIDKSVPLILDKCVLEIPQLEQLVSIFNHEKRSILYIDYQTFYSINKLHYISFVNKIPPNFKSKVYFIRSTDFAFDFSSVEYLKQTVYSYFEKQTISTPRKIFISRSNCSKRRNNEAELFPFLQRYGYEIIYPESLSVKEQYFYFANAEHIIAAAGAALTNVIFCKPKCEILVFQTTHADITIFSSIAGYNQVNMIYIAGLYKTTKLHPDFVIPVDLVEQYLKTYDNE